MKDNRILRAFKRSVPHILGVVFSFTLLIGSPALAYGQKASFCDRVAAEIKNSGLTDGRSANEAMRAMQCLINRKGDQTPFWGVIVDDGVSQTFGPSPFEVVALFHVSSIF